MDMKTKLALKNMAIGALIASMALTFPKITMVLSLAFIAWLIVPEVIGAYKDTRRG
jgi:hypothetical protein